MIIDVNCQNIIERHFPQLPFKCIYFIATGQQEKDVWL